MKNLLCLSFCSLPGNGLFLSGCSQDFFSLLSVFTNLIIMCLDIDFFGLILFGVTQLLEPVDLCLSPNSEGGGGQSLFLFQAHSLSLLWDSNDMNVRFFVIVPKVPETLFFFSFHFLSVVQIG